jgi:hypothetical protein
LDADPFDAVGPRNQRDQLFEGNRTKLILLVRGASRPGQGNAKALPR